MAKGAAAAAAKNAPPPEAVVDAPVVDAPAAAPAAGGMTPEKLAMLKELAELRSQGVLSDAEFEVEKAKLLHG